MGKEARKKYLRQRKKKHTKIQEYVVYLRTKIRSLVTKVLLARYRLVQFGAIEEYNGYVVMNSDDIVGEYQCILFSCRSKGFLFLTLSTIGRPQNSEYKIGIIQKAVLTGFDLTVGVKKVQR